MRYFAHIAYHGYHYSGWQRQANAIGIQDIIEDRISQLLKRKTVILGCGRTDAMVHACQYFFHFDSEMELSLQHVSILNKILPQSIRIYELIAVEENQHAQFDATSRTYNYFYHFSPSPFLSEWSSYYPTAPVAIEKMKRALEVIHRYNDFSGLCKTPDRHSITNCVIRSTQLYTNANNTQIRFKITANRFLRGMIRIIAGKLLEIGNENLSIDEFESYIREKTRPAFLNLAHPQGLYLSQIEYPYLKISPKISECPIFNSIPWIKI